MTGGRVDESLNELRQSLLSAALGRGGSRVRGGTPLVQRSRRSNRHYWKGHFVRELPDELIDALLERIVAFGRPPGGVLIESLHGAPEKPTSKASNSPHGSGMP